MHRFRRHLTSAHAIALIALIVALSGSAYAAASLPNDSVGTHQLRDGAVTKAKISRHTRAALHGVRGRRGKTGAKGAKGAAGTKGVAGQQGARGGTGITGATGPSDLYAAGNSSTTLSHTVKTVASVTVPPGSYILEATVNLTSSPNGSVGCTLEGLSATYDSKSVDPASAGDNEDMALSGAATLTTQQVLRLNCSTLSTGGTAGNARLFAIKTGRIHATLPLPLGT